MGPQVLIHSELIVLGLFLIYRFRSTQVHRTYDNGAPGSLILSYCSLQMMLTHTCSVNDVCVHPNQGELISCDQAGCIKQWDLSENLCSHELVRQIHLHFSDFLTHKCKTPAGDVPIRSVSLASDGSCLVAGNNKAWLQCSG